MSNENTSTVSDEMDSVKEPQTKVVTTYREKKIGNTLYRITSVFLGEFELGPALEELAVKKVLREIRETESIQ